MHAAEEDHHREGEGEGEDHRQPGGEHDARLRQRVEHVRPHGAAIRERADESDEEVEGEGDVHGGVDDAVHVSVRRRLVQRLEGGREEGLGREAEGEGRQREEGLRREDGGGERLGGGGVGRRRGEGDDGDGEEEASHPDGGSALQRVHAAQERERRQTNRGEGDEQEQGEEGVVERAVADWPAVVDATVAERGGEDGEGFSDDDQVRDGGPEEEEERRPVDQRGDPVRHVRAEANVRVLARGEAGAQQEQ
mmetsp:Transcript_25813/g.83104  ORF Transcript_25813/g.83104 Transcript_25813/m.83104 type:complete len:251 (+) Transcript_25813:444-1196(+)